MTDTEGKWRPWTTDEVRQSEARRELMEYEARQSRAWTWFWLSVVAFGVAFGGLCQLMGW